MKERDTANKQLIEAKDRDQLFRKLVREEGLDWDASVDLTGTTVLKDYINTHGWPSIAVDGVVACDSAWLLAQHADHDVKFQKLCSQLLEAKMLASEASREHYALLYDRIKVNQGEPQRFGTQIYAVDGVYMPREIEDLENVDQRRAEYDLGLLAEYVAMFN